MKKLIIILGFAGLFFLTASAATKEKKQTNCPICKMKINKSLYADYKGERVYFGCGGCPDTFKKDPEKYVKQLKDEGVALEKAPKIQTHCPICSMPVNKELYADYKGERVYFGCGGCPDTFKKDPEKYINKLKDAGVTLEKTTCDTNHECSSECKDKH